MGAFVVKRILDEGHEVVAMARSTSDTSHLLNVLHSDSIPERLQILKLHELSQAHALVMDARPTAIVHIAAFGGHSHTLDDIAPILETNIHLGTLLLEACCDLAESAPSFVFCGSFWQNATNATTNSPNSLYAGTKSAFEEIARYYKDVRGVNLLGLKFYDNYGTPDPRGRLIKYLVDCTLSQRRVELSPGWQKIRPLYVTDATDAIYTALMEMSASSYDALSYGVVGNELVSIRELVSLIEELSGKRLDIGWSVKDYRPNEIFEPVMLPQLPNWSAKTPLRDGIMSMLDGAT